LSSHSVTQPHTVCLANSQTSGQLQVNFRLKQMVPAPAPQTAYPRKRLSSGASTPTVEHVHDNASSRSISPPASASSVKQQQLLPEYLQEYLYGKDLHGKDLHQYLHGKDQLPPPDAAAMKSQQRVSTGLHGSQRPRPWHSSTPYRSSPFRLEDRREAEAEAQAQATSASTATTATIALLPLAIAAAAVRVRLLASSATRC